MKKLKLSNGGSTLVDDEDFEKVNKWKWQKNKKGYVSRSFKLSSLSLHKFIMGEYPPKLNYIDHINRDILDNRKLNLRFCTKAQNHQNGDKHSHNTSGFKGVWFAKSRLENKEIKKDRKLWIAEIQANKVRKFIGLFRTAEAAAIAYDEYAKRLHGDFAVLNFPKFTPDSS